MSARERWSRSSIVTFALGMLFGAPSLAYPLGSDQALFWYVGRGWLLYGAVPYRDAFDVKPPPIFLVHGLASLVSGGGMWGIRLVEWLAMIPIGWPVGKFGPVTRAPVETITYWNSWGTTRERD